MYLVRNRVRLVTREEIFASVWPDVIVTEASLSTALHEVRRALGDDVRTPRYIQTLRAQGFRFVADASESPTESAPPGEPDSAATPSRGRVRLVISVIAAALLILVVVAGMYTASDRAPTGTGLTTIAVLPFEDLSAQGDHAWLANAVTETLTEHLSRIAALTVHGRTRTARLRETGRELATIVAELKVDSLVDGSIQVAGDDVRIIARLVGASGQGQLWSGRFDGILTDVFDLQSEVSRQIAEAIRTELGIDERWGYEVVDRYAPRDVRAYELLRRGVEIGMQDGFSLQSLNQRLDYYEQALAVDPEYADAHAVLGLTLATFRRVEPNQIDRARKAFERALALAPGHPRALIGLAMIARGEGRHSDALLLLEQALESHPRNGELLNAYANLLATLGRTEEAADIYQRSIDVGVFAGEAFASLGVLNYEAGDCDGALDLFQNAAEFLPYYARQLWLFVADCQHRRGEDAEAMRTALRALPPAAEASVRAGYASAGWPGALGVTLRFHTEGQNAPCPQPLNEVTMLAAMLGETEQLLGCLALGRTSRLEPWSSLLDPYRNDPRFQELSRRWPAPAVSNR